VDPTEVYADPAGPSYVVADPDLVGSATCFADRIRNKIVLKEVNIVFLNIVFKESFEPLTAAMLCHC
jgi:hypothetical protein